MAWLVSDLNNTHLEIPVIFILIFMTIICYIQHYFFCSLDIFILRGCLEALSFRLFENVGRPAGPVNFTETVVFILFFIFYFLYHQYLFLS